MEKIKQRITNKIYHKTVKSLGDAMLVESQLKTLGLPINRFAKFVALHEKRCILTGDLPMILCLSSDKVSFVEETFEESIRDGKMITTATCVMKRVGIGGEFRNTYSELDAKEHSIDLKEYYLKFKKKVLRWKARELTIMQGFGDVVCGGIGYYELLEEDKLPVKTELSEINLARKKIHESILSEPIEGAPKFELPN